MADWSSDVLKLRAWEVARAVASGPRCSDHRLGVQVVAEATGRKKFAGTGEGREWDVGRRPAWKEQSQLKAKEKPRLLRTCHPASKR